MAGGDVRSCSNRSCEQKSPLKLVLGRFFSWTDKERSPDHPDGADPSDQHLIENGARLFKALIVSCRGRSNPIRIFSAKELMKATHGYDERRFLGSSLSEVYGGVFDGRLIAIKRAIGQFANLSDLEAFDLFLNEVIALSQVNHRNVVKLLGCCIETRVPMLVYELVPRGSLHQHLHVADASRRIPWADRLRVATEVADALNYLHTALHKPIIHGDVQSWSILLDDHNSAKLGAFAFSEQALDEQPDERCSRDGSYTDFTRRRRRNEKDDVFCFGLLLIELLTRKEPTEGYERGTRTVSLKRFASSIRENSLESVLDGSISNEDRNMEQIAACARVAMRCSTVDAEKRPTMKELVQELRRIRVLCSSV